MSDLLAEIIRRQTERERLDWGDGIDDAIEQRRIGTWVAPIVADVLDILSADGRLHPTMPAYLTAADQADGEVSGE